MLGWETTNEWGYHRDPCDLLSAAGRENKLKNKLKNKKIPTFCCWWWCSSSSSSSFLVHRQHFFPLLDIYQARSKEEVWKEKIRDSRWPRFSSLYNWLTKEQDWFTIYIYIYTSCISISHDSWRFLFFCLYQRPDDYPPLAQLGRHFFRLFHCWAD